MNNLYRARLKGKVEEKASHFSTSIQEDEKIFEEDIYGTEAHDIMLYEQGVITKEDLKQILSALEKLRIEKRNGRVKLDSKYEDIHELVEDYVINEIGLEVGGKLHTGRSRNDQIALDIRMSLRVDLNEISCLLLSLVRTLLENAEKYKESPMLLYTHTQHAQVGTFSHYLLAYIDALFRDLQRLQDCYDRVNLSPLGAGPIGGTSIAISRDRTVLLLGFDGILENSIDAVSSRDFMLEALSVLATLMSGISRVAVDLILWSSSEFGYVEIDDRYASVSSIMPHKKNPNVLELIRGKASKVYGNLMGLFGMLTSLTTGYSSDLQETKPQLWSSIDVVESSLEVLIGVIATLTVNTQRMTDLLSESYAFAVDLVELLIAKTDLSFREAHMVVGNLIREMISQGVKPKNLQPKTLEKIIAKVLKKKIRIEGDLLRDITDPQIVLEKRKPIGSPSQRECQRMLKTRMNTLRKSEARVAARIEQLDKSRKKLIETIQKYCFAP